jgi:hypothetical protein
MNSKLLLTLAVLAALAFVCSSKALIESDNESAIMEKVTDVVEVNKEKRMKSKESDIGDEDDEEEEEKREKTKKKKWSQKKKDQKKHRDEQKEAKDDDVTEGKFELLVLGFKNLKIKIIFFFERNFFAR